VRLVSTLLYIVMLSVNLPVAFAQNSAPSSGFAIVTLVSGNIAGLIATESLSNTTISGAEHTRVAPSALITGASMLVPVGSGGENTTGIAITNPSSGSGSVNLVLTDGRGDVVLNSIINLGPRGHFSRFLNQLFTVPPSGFSNPLLLTVSSEIPVAILALSFRANDFATVPLTSLTSPTPVPFQPLPTSATIGGPASLIFAQVATGGDWSTEIAVGNTSAGLQTIRIDFFADNGVFTGSLTDIVIPSRGVFTFNTAQNR
jgi:hypothetical protein